MAVPNSSDAQSKVETEPEQKTTSSKHFVWKEVRFWISAFSGFALMIRYKAMFPTQDPVIDFFVAIAASFLIAFIAGFPIRQIIVQLLKDLLQISQF